MLAITSDLLIPLGEFRFTFSRSGGPGGQNVNKVNSKVTLHWDVANSASLPSDVRERFLARFGQRMNQDGELVMHSQRYRDQLRNREDCLNKVRQLVLAVLTPPKKRRRTRPTRAARERRLAAKQRTAQKKRLRRQPSSSD